MMPPVVITLLFLTTTASLSSYSPLVNLMPSNSSATQTDEEIAAQDNQGTGPAPAPPLQQLSFHNPQGEFVT